MIRERLAASAARGRPGFRMRGGDVSRVEGFSDAVFGFALTLLVVSLEVPRTFHELLSAMRGFVAFAISFYLLIQVWYGHVVFFRRYGLQDRVTIALNCVLLFVVLFYVYPLKFLFTLVVSQLTGTDATIPRPGGAEPMIQIGDVWLLFVIYGAGFTAVSLVFAALYRHAHRRREDLELDELERFDTRAEIVRYLLLASVGLVSIAVAVVSDRRQSGLAGFVYFLIGAVEWIHGSRTAKRRRALASCAGPETRRGDQP